MDKLETNSNSANLEISDTLDEVIIANSSNVKTQYDIRGFVPKRETSKLKYKRKPLDHSANNLVSCFSGDVIFKDFSNDKYIKGIHQYASSSFPIDQMSPYLVAYPNNENDIFKAIQYAKETGKKIVARSGGHQYCGYSSGGENTIVLDLKNFNKISVNRDDAIADVEPAVTLETLALELRQNKMTIPHGECPKVNIGGHAQTGGFGHLFRSFGLTSDWVISFDIILSTETKVITITKPNKYDPPSLNSEIFWGVLGGNAGSFGIITKYRFKCIKDSDYEGSFSYSFKRKFSKEAFKNVMEVVQDWTRRIVSNTLPSGLDFMMTVETDSFPDLFKYSPMVIELVYVEKGEHVNPRNEFDEIINAAKSDIGCLENLTLDGAQLFSNFLEKVMPVSLVDYKPTLLGKEEKKGLSEISYSFIRRYPLTTLDGREFGLPYKKRVNVTNKPLTNEFITQLSDIIEQVDNTKGLHLVFQMAIGGGEFKNNKDNRKLLSFPHRDSLYNFVFDIFYEEGKENEAIHIQNEVQNIIINTYNHGQERRLFWGTFGPSEERDMNILNVRKMYYDDEDKYYRLQILKKIVDPSDVFHTEMTVQLPQ